MTARSIGVAASLVLRPLLEGAPRRLPRTLALHAAVHFGPIALVSPEAVRLPHACVVADPSRLAEVSRAGHLEVGAGRMVGDGWSLQVRRWWDPHPRLAPTTAPDLAAALAQLHDFRSTYPRSADPVSARESAWTQVTAGFLRGPGRAVWPAGTESPGGLAARLGSGPGLTPESDDELVGFLGSTRLLARALGVAPPPWLEMTASWVRAEAPRRTSDLSARLLVHACRGEVMEPLGTMLAALAGRGDVAGAAARLVGVGHTSGRAMIAGVARGAAVTLSLAGADELAAA